MSGHSFVSRLGARHILFTCEIKFKLVSVWVLPLLNLGLRLATCHTFRVWGLLPPPVRVCGFHLNALLRFRVCHFLLLLCMSSNCFVFRFTVCADITSDLCWFQFRCLQRLSRLTGWVCGLPLTTPLGSSVCYFLLLLGVSLTCFCVSSVGSVGERLATHHTFRV